MIFFLALSETDRQRREQIRVQFALWELQEKLFRNLMHKELQLIRET